VIGIEAAIDGGSLSLFIDGKEVDHYVGEKGISRAEGLLPTLDRMLRQNEVSRKQIDKVVVSTGPGSFTGIKIGIASAMGLADGLDRPLVGMSALAALTSAVEAEEDLLTAVPVGRDLVCIQQFNRSAGEWRPTSNAELLSETEFLHALTMNNGTAVLYDQLYRRHPFTPADSVFSAGSNIASLLVRSDLNGHCSSDVTPFFIDRKPPAVVS
jgi:tRNA threonylcarbamoyladenosine biosynthesis protein TsaB